MEHSVIDALALGRHWRLWSFGLKGGGGGGGGGGVEDFRDKEAGGSQMVDHKKCRGYVNFKLKLLNLKKSDFRNKKSVTHGKNSC